MATQYSFGKVVTNGLVLSLDAGDKNSYPGTGTTWFDISGNRRNFTFNATPTFTTERGGGITFDGTDDYCTGPASNAFSLDQEFTIEFAGKSTVTAASYAIFFQWWNNSGGRAILSSWPFGGGDNNVYYDVGGCCGATQRITWEGSSTLNVNAYGAFRCRVGTNPTRQIFVNNVSVADSGVNSTATITYGTTAAIIGAYDTGNYFHKGNLYMFRMYNRALTDAEMTQNYQAQKARFGL